MHIIVCVKQVPGVSQVGIDPETGVLQRDGVAGKLNPYDLFALEEAFLLAERTGGTVRTLSMGPPQAAAALEETLWMGADGAVLLSDRRFGGSDVAATSYALSLGVAAMGEYDLILCGKQTTDGDTAQVGPETAERLGIEHAANVIRIEDVDAGYVTVTLDLDGYLQTQRMRLPCLLSMDKDVNTPRLPSYRRRQATDARADLRVLSADDLSGVDLARLGLKGSPTQVERIFPPDANTEKTMLHGTAEELSDRLYAMLVEEKFI